MLAIKNPRIKDYSDLVEHYIPELIAEVRRLAPVWTSEAPTESGVYWLSLEDGSESIADVQCGAGGGEILAYIPGLARVLRVLDLRGARWAGPIPPPVEAGNPGGPAQGGLWTAGEGEGGE